MSRPLPSEVDIRGLPGLPELFADYVARSSRAARVLSRRPTLDAAADTARRLARGAGPDSLFLSLLARQTAGNEAGGGTRGNLARIASGRAVAVLFVLRPFPLGGLLFELHKALTAVRLADELTSRGAAAVPVGCVSGLGMEGVRAIAYGFLGAAGKYQETRIELEEEAGVDSHTRRLVPRSIGSTLESIGSLLGPHAPPSDYWELLRRTHPAGSEIHAASSHLWTRLLSDPGVPVADLSHPEARPFFRADGPEYLSRLAGRVRAGLGRAREAGYSWPDIPGALVATAPDGLQEDTHRGAAMAAMALCSALPAAALVADPWQLVGFSALAAEIEESGGAAPAIWPQASLTILDRRSRRLLERHRCDLAQLFGDADALVDRAMTHDNGPAPLPGIEAMIVEVRSRLARMGQAMGSRRADRVHLGKLSRRILYQIEKTGARCRRARGERIAALRRQFGRACGRVAPKRWLQELQLTTLQFFADYSPGAVHAVCERMDTDGSGHQLLTME